MSTYSLLLIFVLMINLHYLLSLISLKNDNNKKAALFFFIIITLWVVQDFLNFTFPYEKYLTFRLKITSIFWLPLGFLYLNIVYNFINKKKDAIYNFFLIYLIISILISIFTNYLIISFKKYSWGIDIIPGNLYSQITSSAVFLPFFYSLYLLVHQLIKNKINNLKKEIIIFISGILFILFISFMTNVALPYIFKIKNFIPLNSLVSFAPVILIYYIIKKQNLYH